MPHAPERSGPQVYFPIGLPVSLLTRIEAVAPSSDRQRSDFIRKALVEKLDRIEREAARPAELTADDS
jgi:metal-responsive CopG/Arc/MetJ family transcriptional regulator